MAYKHTGVIQSIAKELIKSKITGPLSKALIGDSMTRGGTESRIAGLRG